MLISAEAETLVDPLVVEDATVGAVDMLVAHGVVVPDSFAGGHAETLIAHGVAAAPDSSAGGHAEKLIAHGVAAAPDSFVGGDAETLVAQGNPRDLARL